ncbi:hypothetical protein GCM10028775_80770 [Catellatospora paridis]
MAYRHWVGADSGGSSRHLAGGVTLLRARAAASAETSLEADQVDEWFAQDGDGQREQRVELLHELRVDGA